MPCGQTAVLLGWPLVSCMSLPANMAAANQGAPFSRFFGLCHASRSSIYAIFQLDSDEARPAQKSHPPTPLLGWKWGQWAAVYNKCAKCRPMPSCCGSHWYIGGWVYVRVTIQACVFLRCSSPVTSDSHQPLYGFKLYFFGMGMYRMNRART